VLRHSSKRPIATNLRPQHVHSIRAAHKPLLHAPMHSLAPSFAVVHGFSFLPAFLPSILTLLRHPFLFALRVSFAFYPRNALLFVFESFLAPSIRPFSPLKTLGRLPHYRLDPFRLFAARREGKQVVKPTSKSSKSSCHIILRTDNISSKRWLSKRLSFPRERPHPSDTPNPAFGPIEVREITLI